MNLYEELVSNNIPVDNHESDLYFLSTPVSMKILAKYPTQKTNSSLFKSNTDNKIWVDVPFAFLPFWEKCYKA